MREEVKPEPKAERKYPLPTFDEWYKATHMGYSWDSHNLLQHSNKEMAFKNLTKELRAYVSEMVNR